MTRLDAKEAERPASEQKAIAASRRRAQGHLWALGVVMASVFVFALLFGVNRPPLEPMTLLLATAIAVADAFFFHKALAAYEDAKRIHGNGGKGPSSPTATGG